jgi:hypothetical protein
MRKHKRTILSLCPPRCRVCGCTDARACPEGCYWVESDLCSACEELVDWIDREFNRGDRWPAVIVAIGYGLAAERSYGPPHDEDLIAEMESALDDSPIPFFLPSGELAFFDPTLGEDFE